MFKNISVNAMTAGGAGFGSAGQAEALQIIRHLEHQPLLGGDPVKEQQVEVDREKHGEGIDGVALPTPTFLEKKMNAFKNYFVSVLPESCGIERDDGKCYFTGKCKSDSIVDLATNIFALNKIKECEEYVVRGTVEIVTDVTLIDRQYTIEENGKIIIKQGGAVKCAYENEKVELNKLHTGCSIAIKKKGKLQIDEGGSLKVAEDNITVHEGGIYLPAGHKEVKSIKSLWVKSKEG